jgi:predicted metal-dependent phosphoesterase TrpH
MKAELHAHCSLDPDDYRLCLFSPERLISQAAVLGYEVLAITCHNMDIWNHELSEFARSQGIVLLPGMEVSSEGNRHVLVYNFKTGPENLNTLKKISERSRADTLVIAPHPYFPGRKCLRNLLAKHIHVFDAIEISGFYVPGIDFNRKAIKLAEKHKKPMVGSGDVHLLWQMGKTCTWIYSQPEAAQVLTAVKQGNVQVEMKMLTYFQATRWWATALWRHVVPSHPVPSTMTHPYIPLDSWHHLR